MKPTAKEDYLQITPEIAETARRESRLMNVTPQEWLEHKIGVLDLKDEFEIAALKLPEKEHAPQYSDRTDRNQTPLDFYDVNYRQFSEAGILYQHTLRHLDPKLVQAVRSYCQNRDIDPSNHLPPTKRVMIDRQIEKTGLSIEDIRRLGVSANYRLEQ